MTTVKKKSKLTLPPTAQQVDDKALKAMIEKGGAVASSKDKANLGEDKLRSFTVKIYESELAALRAIQERAGQRDKPSIQDIIIAAVKDRIKKG